MPRNPIQNYICKQSAFTRPIALNADSLMFYEGGSYIYIKTISLFQLVWFIPVKPSWWLNGGLIFSQGCKLCVKIKETLARLLYYMAIIGLDKYMS